MARPFQFVGGEPGETPESIARKRAIAEALLSQGRPAQNVGEGLVDVARALRGRWDMKKLDKAEAAGRAGAGDAFSSIVAALGGGGDLSMASGAPMGGGATGDAGSYADAIASIESAGSGDYAAVGPRNAKLGRPLGRYQVMEANVGPWSREALGREVTADEFLANPQIQDAIFNKQFGGYVDKFGSPEAAAQAWFGGPGAVGKTGRQDVLGTSVGEYGQRFSQALGPGGSVPAQVASLDPAAGMALQAPQGGVPAVAQALAAQGGGMPPQAAAAPVQTAQAGPSMQQLLQAASDPWLSEGERSVVNALLTRQMEQQDPANQMALEKSRLELDQLRNPQLSPGDALAREKFEFEKSQGPKGPDLETLYDEATGQEFKGRWNPQTQTFDRVGGIKAQSGTSLTVGPDGEIQFQMGAGQKLTEGQSKDSVFVTRAAGALPLIDKFGDALTSLPETAAGGLGVVGNYMKSKEFQQAEQAGLEFLQAILRKDTGAAITPQETAEYGKVYLPQPGNPPEVLAQKKISRNRAVAAIQMGMPAAQILALENAGVGMATMPQSGTPEAAAPPDATSGSMPDSFLSGQNVDPKIRARAWEIFQENQKRAPAP